MFFHVLTVVDKNIICPYFFFPSFQSRLSTLFVAASLGWNITIVIGLSQDWQRLWVAKLEGKKSTTFCQVQGILVQFFISIQILLWLGECS